MSAPSALPGFPDGEHRAIGRDSRGWFRQSCVCSLGKDHALGARGSLATARQAVQRGSLVALRRPNPRLVSWGDSDPQNAPQGRAGNPELVRRPPVTPEERDAMLREATIARTKVMTADAVRRARERLAAGGLPKHCEEILRLRVEHPEAYGEQLSVISGLTRNAFGARLRRALAYPVQAEGQEAS